MSDDSQGSRSSDHIEHTDSSHRDDGIYVGWRDTRFRISPFKLVVGLILLGLCGIPALGMYTNKLELEGFHQARAREYQTAEVASAPERTATTSAWATIIAQGSIDKTATS